MKKKWIWRAIVALPLLVMLYYLVVVGIGLGGYVVGSYRYRQLHLKTYEATSLAKLQEMAPRVIKIPDGSYYRGQDIPAALQELDPNWVSVQEDQIFIELHGGFDHFGFIYRKSENAPRTWEIFRHTEEGGEQLMGTFEAPLQNTPPQE